MRKFCGDAVLFATFIFSNILSDTRFQVLPLSTKHLAGIDAIYAGIKLRGSVVCLLLFIGLRPPTAAVFV